MKKIYAAAGLMIFALSVQAEAQQTADDDRLDEAWKAVLEGQEGVLTPQQFATINGLAYQAAVTRLCGGFELDNIKYAKAVNAVVNSGDDNFPMNSRLNVRPTSSSHSVRLTVSSWPKAQRRKTRSAWGWRGEQGQ